MDTKDYFKMMYSHFRRQLKREGTDVANWITYYANRRDGSARHRSVCKAVSYAYQSREGVKA